MRFLLVIILLAGSFAVEHNHSSSAVIYAHTSSGSYNTTQGENVSYWDWEWHMPSHISDKKATSGYE
jgi:gentisate 1,2-dioxygenase